MTLDSPLGIIAGEGNFPYLVADGARMQKRKTVAVGFKGHTEPGFASHVDVFTWLRIGQLGRLLSFFKGQGVLEIVFAGAINKPKALGMRPDLQAARFLFQNRSKNDNALLSGLIRLLEEEQGFRVVSPGRLASGLRMPAGVLTTRKPTEPERADIHFGWPLVKQIGSLDIGQCLVVRQGMVVAVEAMEGTNRTILRAGELAGKGGGGPQGLQAGTGGTCRPAVGRPGDRQDHDQGQSHLPGGRDRKEPFF